MKPFIHQADTLDTFLPHTHTDTQTDTHHTPLHIQIRRVTSLSHRGTPYMYLPLGEVVRSRADPILSRPYAHGRVPILQTHGDQTPLLGHRQGQGLCHPPDHAAEPHAVVMRLHTSQRRWPHGTCVYSRHLPRVDAINTFLLPLPSAPTPTSAPPPHTHTIAPFSDALPPSARARARAHHTPAPCCPCCTLFRTPAP